MSDSKTTKLTPNQLQILETAEQLVAKEASSEITVTLSSADIVASAPTIVKPVPPMAKPSSD